MEEQRRNFSDISCYKDGKPWLSPDYLMYYHYSAIPFMAFGEKISFSIYVRNDFKTIIYADGIDGITTFYAETQLRMNSSNTSVAFLQSILKLDAFTPTCYDMGCTEMDTHTCVINHPINGTVIVSSNCGQFQRGESMSDKLLFRVSEAVMQWKDAVYQNFIS